LPEAKFFCLLSKQLRICGYHEFGFKDLAAPQAKRFRRQLSALINFLKYREDMGHLEMQALDEVSGVFRRFGDAMCRCFLVIPLRTFYNIRIDDVLFSLSFDFSSVVVQREELFAALDEVTENHMTLKGQLDEARAINRERVMEREEAEEECKEVSYIYSPTIVTRDAARVSESSTTMRALRRSETRKCNIDPSHPSLPPPPPIAQMEAEIAQQNKIQASIRQETYLLKKSANELQDQIANLSIALRELKAEERRLSKEVVHTPDRIRSDLAEATRRFECVRRSISDAQAERASVQKRAEHASMAEDVAGRIAAVMEGMDTAVQDYEMAAEDLENAQSTLEKMERDKEGTMEEKESQERKLDAAGKLSYFPMNRIESPPNLPTRYLVSTTRPTTRTQRPPCISRRVRREAKVRRDVIARRRAAHLPERSRPRRRAIGSCRIGCRRGRGQDRGSRATRRGDEGSHRGGEDARGGGRVRQVGVVSEVRGDVLGEGTTA
jgi:kinetochore protein Nuf2